MSFTRERIFSVGGRRSWLQVIDRGGELMDHQLHPELRDLVLNDEEQLVVVLGPRERMLLREQAFKREIARVAEAIREVA